MKQANLFEKPITFSNEFENLIGSSTTLEVGRPTAPDYDFEADMIRLHKLSPEEFEKELYKDETNNS